MKTQVLEEAQKLELEALEYTRAMATQAGITELENTYKTPINNEEIYFNGILDICSNRKISRIKSLALKTRLATL
jgi:hypothetical protein